MPQSNSYYQPQHQAPPQAYANSNTLQFYSSSAASSPGLPHQQFFPSGAPASHRQTPTASAASPNPEASTGYYRSDVIGNIGSNMSGGTGASSVNSGPIVVQNWFNAFTPWTGMDNEPPLLEELGINFDHIMQKSLAVLNPLGTIDERIMDDADLAGPLVYCFLFGTLLLMSGRPQFSFIYGVAAVGSISIYGLLYMMSENHIDVYRTTSVLGYCLLPLIMLTLLSVFVSLDGAIGYTLAALTIIWCSYSASSMFASVLRLQSQRFLVAYPVALLYTAFSLLSIFDGKTGGVGVKS